MVVIVAHWNLIVAHWNLIVAHWNAIVVIGTLLLLIGSNGMVKKELLLLISNNSFNLTKNYCC